MKWSDKVKYQGKTLNRGTLAIFTAMNTILQQSPRYGREKENVTLVQGSYNGTVSASAGTHNGGGAYDITNFNYKNRVKVLRILGTATWYRPTIKNLWSAHIHGIVCGDGSASKGALGQVTAYYNGRNGLANNAKDPDWRPKVLPILFVAPWDDRGKPGPMYFTKDQARYEEPNTKGKKQGTSKKGDLFTVVAVVNVKGELWAINPHGDCVPKASLTAKKPVKPSLPATTPFIAEWRVTKSGKWGLDGPGGKQKYERAAGYHLYTVAKATVNGVQWYVTEANTWYDADHLVPWIEPGVPEKKPDPTPKSVTLNIGTINVIRWRLGTKNERGVGSFKKGLDYKDRVPGFVKMREAMGVSMFSTTESGQYKDADAITAKLGKEWANFLHGDNAGDLTAAIHWHTPKRKVLSKGKFTTAGSHHNWATWGLFQDIKSGVIFLHAATHLNHESRSSGATPSAADTLRGQQTKALIKKSKEIAADAAKKYGVKNVPIVFSGDFNSDKDDKHDLVGEEMKAAGYEDAEVLAETKTGPTTTYPNLPGYTPSPRRFDRFFVPKGTPVKWMRTVEGPPYTDHNGVSIQVTLTNEGA